MAVNLAGDRLPCGHDIDQLWDHLVRDAGLGITCFVRTLWQSEFAQPWWLLLLLLLPGVVWISYRSLAGLGPVRRWAGSRIRRAVRQNRAKREPSVIELGPKEWRELPGQLTGGQRDDRRQGPPASPTA